LPKGVSEEKLNSKVIPGVWIDVSWLWQQELPAPLQCLREVFG
jgi:hypothetical protein